MTGTVDARRRARWVETPYDVIGIDFGAGPSWGAWVWRVGGRIVAEGDVRASEPAPMLPGYVLDGRVLTRPEHDAGRGRQQTSNTRVKRERFEARWLKAQRGFGSVTHDGRLQLMGQLAERLAEIVQDVEDGRSDLLVEAAAEARVLIDELGSSLDDLERWIIRLAQRQGVSLDESMWRVAGERAQAREVSK